jgi:uncharacterized protein
MSALPLLALAASGAAGGIAGILLRVPLGALVGSLAGAGAYQILVGGAPAALPEVRMVAQVLVGLMVGGSVSRSVLSTMRSIIGPVLVVCLAMPVAGLVVGWLMLERAGHVDLVTAFLATAPAGATEMGTAALAFHADAELVIATHVARMVSIGFLGGMLLPLVIRLRARRTSRRTAPGPSAAPAGEGCTPERTDRSGLEDPGRSAGGSGSAGT